MSRITDEKWEVVVAELPHHVTMKLSLAGISSAECAGYFMDIMEFLKDDVLACRELDDHNYELRLARAVCRKKYQGQ